MIKKKNIPLIFTLFLLAHLLIWTLVPFFSNKNLTRWYELISKREAVKRGYDLFGKGEKVPNV